jgi:hypothetical protein
MLYTATQVSCSRVHPRSLTCLPACLPAPPLPQVTSSFKGASFPLGQRFVSRATPGATKASLIAALADVGAGMEAPVVYQARFTDSQAEGGVVADRAFNIQQQVGEG